MSNVNDLANKEKSNVKKVFRLKFFNSKNVSILFFCFACLFALLTIIILYTTSSNLFKPLDYTDCIKNSSQRFLNQTTFRNSSFLNRSNQQEICHLNFRIEEDLYEIPFFYYQMFDYHKNFLSFSESYSKKQMLGDFNLEVLEECSEHTDDSLIDYADKCSIAPCGELPNFLFNDTFKIYYLLNYSRFPIEINTHNITDPYFNLNFHNPNSLHEMQIIQNLTQRPRNWRKNLFDLDSNSNNGYVNERLIVWLFPNAFSDFSKLYGRITARFDEQLNGQPAEEQDKHIKAYMDYLKNKHSRKLSPYLRKGIYTVEIEFNYPIWSNLSRKFFYMTTVGVFGQFNLLFRIFICLASFVSILGMTFVFFIYRIHDEKCRLYICKNNSDVDILF